MRCCYKFTTDADMLYFRTVSMNYRHDLRMFRIIGVGQFATIQRRSSLIMSSILFVVTRCRGDEGAGQICFSFQSKQIIFDAGLCFKPTEWIRFL